MLTVGKQKLDPKGVALLANALKSASQAQSVSTVRRQRIQSEFKDQVDEVVAAAEKSPTLTTDGRAVIKKIREEIYGIFDE
ncbi:hypothetical protein AX761_23375 [Rhizobium sp. 58]|nr:hypothetical protein AX761_23375 [Rhizobium sp. 58]